MKTVRNFILVFFVLGIFLSLGFYRLQFVKTEKFIPYDADVLLKINDGKKFLFNDKNKRFYNFIMTQKNNQFYFELLSDIRIALDLVNYRILDFLNGNCDIAYVNKKYVVITFDYGFKSLLVKPFFYFAEKYFNDLTYFTISSYYTNNRKIYVVYSKPLKEYYYICIYKNVLVFASDKKVLENKIRPISENNEYSYVNANLDSKKNLRMFFNLEKMYKRNKFIKNRLFELKYAGFYSDDFKTYVNVKGFISVKFKNKRYKNLLLPFNNVSSLLNFLPYNIDNFYAIKFSNARVFYKYLINNFMLKKRKKFEKAVKELENYIGLSINDFLYSWLGNEIIAAEINNDNLFFLKIRNYSKLKKILTFKESSYFTYPDVSVYRHHKIYKLNLNLFYKALGFIFNKKIKMPYFFIFNNYFVLTYNKKLIKNIIDKYEYDDILLYSDVRLIDSLKGNKSDSMFFYWYFNKQKMKQFNFINNLYSKGLIGIAHKGDGLNVGITLFYSDKIKPMLMPYWPVSVRYKIIEQPVIVKLYDPDKFRILSVDKTAVIRVFNVYGKKIATIDMSKYKRKIKNVAGIFFDENRHEYFLLLILKNNNFVTYFLKSKKELVFKYKNYNMVFYKEKQLLVYYKGNNILVVDKDGNIENSLNLFYKARIKNVYIKKDTDDNSLNLVVITDNKEVYKYVYKDKKFVKIFKYKSKFDVDYVLQDDFNKKNDVIIFSKNGKIAVINQKGYKIKFLTDRIYDSFYNKPVISIVDNKKQLVWFSANKKIYILNKYGTVNEIKKINFKLKKGSSINVFDINSDSTDEFITITKNRTIYIINKNGEILYKLRGDKLPVIKDINNDKIPELILKRGNKIYVYMLI